jgi:cell division initiation protein
MITPLDIQNKEFSRAVRGYKEDEVDGFLDLLTLDLEKILNENQKLKAQLKTMEKDLERYRNSENAVLETLEAAKALMGDISISAEKRAEILLKNAELDAVLIQREAKESVEKLNEEIVSLRNRFNVFRTRYKTLLESELDRFDLLSVELFADKDMEDLKALSEAKPATHIKSAPAFEKDMERTITNLRTGDGDKSKPEI